MSAPMIPDVNEPEDQTFGDIVWIQFKKNRVAYWSLWGLGFLFFIAITAPIIANGRPFSWNVGDGTTYPWFSSLFDRNYFENPVDIFFNMLLVCSIPVTLLCVWRLKKIRSMGLDKRPRRARIGSEIRILVGIIMALFIGLLAQPHSEPYTQYWDEYEERLEEGKPVEATFPPVPYMFRTTGFKSLEVL